MRPWSRTARGICRHAVSRPRFGSLYAYISCQSQIKNQANHETSTKTQPPTLPCNRDVPMNDVTVALCTMCVVAAPAHDVLVIVCACSCDCFHDLPVYSTVLTKWEHGGCSV